MTASHRRRHAPRRRPPGRAVAPLLALAALAAPVAAAAQTISGRVLEDGREAPIAGAAVSLVDRGGKHRSGAISDSLGRFVLTPPEPGEYHVVSVRLGYETTRSPLFSMSTEGTAAFDVLMVPEPIGLEGFEVSVAREAEELLRPFGQTPSSLGDRWIGRKSIEEMPMPVGPREVIRWGNIAGVWVHEDGGGANASLCVTFRRARTFSGAERCALVLVDGVMIPPQDAQQSLSHEDIEAIAILTPVEASTFYGTQGGGGVVLIWTRRARQ